MGWGFRTPPELHLLYTSTAGWGCLELLSPLDGARDTPQAVSATCRGGEGGWDGTWDEMRWDEMRWDGMGWDGRMGWGRRCSPFLAAYVASGCLEQACGSVLGHLCMSRAYMRTCVGDSTWATAHLVLRPVAVTAQEGPGEGRGGGGEVSPAQPSSHIGLWPLDARIG